MGQISWVKLKTDMFDNEKIKLIEALPEADTILIIWIKLIAYAGKINAGGYIMLTENIPINEEELATIFNRPINTVRLAIATFERYGMISRDGEAIKITNWALHQNIDGLEKVRLQNKERNQRYRERQKQKELPEGERDVSVTSRDDTEQNRKEENREDKNKREKNTMSNSNESDAAFNQNVKLIIDYLNKKTGKRFMASAEDNKKHIHARFAQGYKLEDFYYVIDVKTDDWLNHPKHNVHLRPRTLFGPKMQDYRNQQRVTVKGQKKGAMEGYDPDVHGDLPF